MDSSHSKVQSSGRHRQRKARFHSKGWVYLPPESNEAILPKHARSSAIQASHIIDKRLRSNVIPKQSSSKVKKTFAERTIEKRKRAFGKGLKKLNQSANLPARYHNPGGTVEEREETIAQESVQFVTSVDDGISSCSSLTDLGDLSEEEVDVIDTQCRQENGDETLSNTNPRTQDEKEPGPKISHEGHLSETHLRKRMQLLEQQVTRLMVRKTEEEAQYQHTINKLLEQNYNQNLRLNMLRTGKKGEKPQSTTNDLLTAELYAQDQEIRRLKSNLNEALRLNELLSPHSTKTYAVEMAKSTRQLMHQIESSVIFAADMLCQALNQPLKQSPHERLGNFILESIGSVDLLQSHSSAAFRAMIFKFIRECIFYSEGMWTTLHFESLMLRVYQTALQQAVTPEFLERFHRAALHLLLQDSNHFKEAFVIPHAEILTIDIMHLLGPYLDNTLLQQSHHEDRLKKCIRDLFCDAIELRASYFPPPGTRYELIQFKPGTVYNPELMQVQPIPIESMNVPPDDSKLLRIKVCVHGAIIAHPTQEISSVGLDRLKDWSQSFIEDMGDKDSDVTMWKGKLTSEKASVILDLQE
ncbi:conserved hypothetical protein [Talaromyces stipitatus ATCC 10500]|uniref:Uncharacterized protein n=1 Tax=Talaromyces stipitatus (strain ATCC 10500 / CBS 375.48 / QM 6759 / NRRL 1006) TaxID=441959 RepID=B8LT27_TALSN|nr:uncharacterized protein TSTA_069540 [Talaromyces stipitatus ATCC 10500]EED23535.1 conserved hypothetical protein [Talaromyces stipitatus ATCC 10500]